MDSVCETIVTLYERDRRYGGFTVKEMRDVALKPMAALTDGEVVDASELLFLDTETTGLSGGAGTVAFLAGVGFFREDGFVVKQYLMRDYDEEASMLENLQSELNARRALVTFNGKAFDVSLLAGRFIMNGLRLPPAGPHLDLLHMARRIWRDCLENCRLSTLEADILYECRSGDIPGSMIPQVYFNYLLRRETEALERVLEHNRLDVLSMAAILRHISGLVGDPGASSRCGGEELFGLGCLFEALGNAEPASSCFAMCLEGKRPSVERRALAKLANMSKRAGDYGGALRYWERMAEFSPKTGISPYVEMAKHYEHRARDPVKAKELTDIALMLEGAARFQADDARFRASVPARAPSQPSQPSRLRAELLARRQRLINKIEQSAKTAGAKAARRQGGRRQGSKAAGGKAADAIIRPCP
jgi:uncharacterized protein YprB with RNaseH-like and TPR domain